MFSWFPIFFPFKEPLYLPSGAELDVGIWRLWDGNRRKIWYEWTAEAYLPTTTSTSGGGAGVNGASGALQAAQSAPAVNAPGPAGGGGAWQTPGGADRTSTGGQNLTVTPGSARSASGPGIPNSPMMDAPFSPGFPSPVWGGAEGGRVKIGQTSLHNATGAHSWVGL
jgi:protein arginine N-methyltransferase 5